MKAAIFFIVLFVGSAFAYLSESQYQDAFVSWTKKHNKGYTSSEFFKRYTTFKDNLAYVNEWNSKNSDTVLGATVYADLTNEEYRRTILGTRYDASVRLENVQREAPKISFQNVYIPKSVDWRQQGAVTEVKNQGQCGSCWSFSTTGAVEGAYFIAKGGNLTSLSEQNLMDCSYNYGNQGCNGGLMEQAFKYIIDNKGIDTEESYPYETAVGTCRYSVANRGATISGYAEVSAGSESSLQAAAAKQPVAVAIDASHYSFQLYKSGVYYESACSPRSLDHGVLLVGYDTDNSGSDYWIVKNSWGKGWGLDGYIHMARNRNNNCGISTMASYPRV